MSCGVKYCNKHEPTTRSSGRGLASRSMRQGTTLGAARKAARLRELPESVGLSRGNRWRQPGTTGGRDVARNSACIVRARRWWRRLRRPWASAAGTGVQQRHSDFERRIFCSALVAGPNCASRGRCGRFSWFLEVVCRLNERSVVAGAIRCDERDDRDCGGR